MEEKNFDTQLESAMTLFKKRDYEGAMEEFKKLLDKDNKNPHLYNNIGLCYSHLGQTTMAEEYFKKALFIDDKMVETYINLAITKKTAFGMQSTFCKELLRLLVTMLL